MPSQNYYVSSVKDVFPFSELLFTNVVTFNMLVCKIPEQSAFTDLRYYANCGITEIFHPDRAVRVQEALRVLPLLLQFCLCIYRMVMHK
jgi:hypothetical protein